METENCCGNCKCFLYEDSFGVGVCFLTDKEVTCEYGCDEFIKDDEDDND